MLTAQFDNGKLISLLDFDNADILKELRSKHVFLCPGCKEQLILKVGTKKRPHFSHQQYSNCHAYSEPESDYHLEGKKQLLHWLKGQKQSAELEKYLPAIAQIPDLFTAFQDKNYAIEFQCSTIPEKLFLKRTAGYQKQNIIPIWILGEKRIRQLSPYTIQLQEMDWLTVNSLQDNLLLYTLDPFKKIIHLYTNLVPLSLNRAYATKKSFPLSTLNFKDLLHPKLPPINNSLFNIWLKRKQNWRFNIFRNSSAPVHFMKTYYYHEHLHFPLFPAEVGIPTNHLAYLQTPSYVWQAWILEFIKKRGIGQIFSFKEVVRQFQEILVQNMFQARQLELAHGNFSLAIMGYLDALCFLGIIKKFSGTLFVIKSEVMYPKTNDEAFQKDKETLQKLKGFYLYGKNM